jgi:prepilin-type N-terminal cleavage/methylation domain-containing protein
MDITTRNIDNGTVKAGQKGFTLIEIIAVLVILGMLAAVAIPKYLSMQQQAAQQVINAAIASGVSQISLEYANQLLQGAAPATAIATAITNCNANYPSIGDFQYSWTAIAGGVTVGVTGGQTATGTSVWQNLPPNPTTTKNVLF